MCPPDTRTWSSGPLKVRRAVVTSPRAESRSRRSGGAGVNGGSERGGVLWLRLGPPDDLFGLLWLISAPLRWICSGSTLPGSTNYEAKGHPFGRAWVRRVSGWNLWPWYRFTDEELVLAPSRPIRRSRPSHWVSAGPSQRLGPPAGSRMTSTDTPAADASVAGFSDLAPRRVHAISGRHDSGAPLRTRSEKMTTT